jgi:ketosteroid isomerase-like protein
MGNFFRDYLAAWDTLDVDTVMAFFTDDIEYRDTTIGHGASGTEAMRQFVAASFKNVPDARFEYVRHHSTGDDYAIEWIMQPMGVVGVSVGSLRDGKIAANRDYWNGAAYKVPNT